MLGPEARDAWRRLADDTDAERVTAMFWMESLRQAASLDDHRTGHFNPLLVALPDRLEDYEYSKLSLTIGAKFGK